MVGAVAVLTHVDHWMLLTAVCKFHIAPVLRVGATMLVVSDFLNLVVSDVDRDTLPICPVRAILVIHDTADLNLQTCWLVTSHTQAFEASVNVPWSMDCGVETKTCVLAWGPIPPSTTKMEMSKKNLLLHDCGNDVTLYNIELNVLSTSNANLHTKNIGRTAPKVTHTHTPTHTRSQYYDTLAVCRHEFE